MVIIKIVLLLKFKYDDKIKIILTIFNLYVK